MMRRRGRDRDGAQIVSTPALMMCGCVAESCARAVAMAVLTDCPWRHWLAVISLWQH